MKIGWLQWAVGALLVVTSVSGIPARLKRGRLGLRSPPTPRSHDVTDLWFPQLLDHSDPTDNHTWMQRYQVRTELHQAGGPAFLMINGEGDMSSYWLTGGSWQVYAKRHNAMLFNLEHRFYGQSHPTSDVSTENLRFLSSEQALADVAYFIEAMSDEYNLTDSKWIVFGGSYAGNLAAWARLKYPHLVHAAMSASGPVLAQVDFPEYFDVVREGLRDYNATCSHSVWRAQYHISQLLRDATGQQVVNDLFHLCEPINVTNQNDVYNLFETLSDYFAEAVQYNGEDPVGMNIDTVCDVMDNVATGNPVTRLASLSNFFNGGLCLDYSYASMINLLQKTSWDIASEYPMRQWMYQTCTEFGYYQTSEEKGQFFSKHFPLQFFLQQCSDIFGPEFTAEEVYAGVYRTNTLYGGLDIAATHVVYVHGSVDPWHVLGVTNSTVPQSPSIMVQGVAHCAVMMDPQPTDPPQLRQARKAVGKLISKWLKQNHL